MLFYHIPILNGGFKGLFASANITTATLCPTHKKPQREKKKAKKEKRKSLFVLLLLLELDRMIF